MPAHMAYGGARRVSCAAKRRCKAVRKRAGAQSRGDPRGSDARGAGCLVRRRQREVTGHKHERASSTLLSPIYTNPRSCCTRAAATEHRARLQEDSFLLEGSDPHFPNTAKSNARNHIPGTKFTEKGFLRVFDFDSRSGTHTAWRAASLLLRAAS